jgi:hypothetical protein
VYLCPAEVAESGGARPLHPTLGSLGWVGWVSLRRISGMDIYATFFTGPIDLHTTALPTRGSTLRLWLETWVWSVLLFYLGSCDPPQIA